MFKALNTNNNRIINGLPCRPKPVQLQTRKPHSMHGKSKGHVSTSRSCGKTLDMLLIFKGNMMSLLHNIQYLTLLFPYCFTVIWIHFSLNKVIYIYWYHDLDSNLILPSFLNIIIQSQYSHFGGFTSLFLCWNIWWTIKTFWEKNISNWCMSVHPIK